GFAGTNIRSFTIPGLVPVDTRTLSGTAGISGEINPVGNRAFARSIFSGNVDAFNYNSTTAVLGALPLLYDSDRRCSIVLWDGSNSAAPERDQVVRVAA